MPLKDILFATVTSSKIEDSAREQLKQLSKSPFELKVKNRQGTASSLLVVVSAIRKGRLLHGHTEDGDHVFIKLGEIIERETRRPSVFLYEGKEPTRTNKSSRRIKP